jgi:hypothetical protein
MSMPPSLNVSQPPAPGTPMDTWSTSTDMCYENRKHLLRLADEMSPFFVGPIGAHVFLDHFLPPPSDPSSVPQFRVGMFKSFIRSLSENETGSCREFVSSDPSPTSLTAPVLWSNLSTFPDTSHFRACPKFNHSRHIPCHRQGSVWQIPSQIAARLLGVYNRQ